MKKLITYDHSVTKLGHILVKRITVTMKDGEVSVVNHRHVISPGENTDGQNAETIRLAKLHHTPKIIAEYNAISTE